MKKRCTRLICMLILFSMLFSNAAFAKVAPAVVTDQRVLSYKYWDTSLTYEERAADLISHMTLEEKVSQLSSHPGAAIPRLGVAEYWYPGEALNGIANIQLWYGADASDAKSAATTYPSDLGQGSTWNTDLIGQMADAIANEARTYYNTSKKGLTHWAPSMNLSRDPRWGRSDEAFAEDPLLSGLFGTAFVKGFQGDFDNSSNYLKAIANVKHFAANNAEFTRNGGSSDMTEAELREYYLRNFEIVEKNSDPASYMAGYNAINGIPSHANYELLNNILRLTWGFDGFVISDHGGVNNLYKAYGTAGINTSPAAIDASFKSDEKFGVSLPVLDGGNEDYNGLYNVKVNDATDAAVVALQSGVDIELQAGKGSMLTKLVGAVNSGAIEEKTIDEALLRIFTPRFASGEFDLSATDYTDTEYQSEIAQILKNKDLAEHVADESIVMLENNGILPLKAANYDNVLVVGQYADTMMYTGYKSTDTEWKKENINVNMYQGIKNYFAEANPAAQVSLLTLKDTDSDGKLNYEPTMEQAYMLNDQKTLVVFVCSMINAALTGGGDTGEANDRTTLTAPRGQLDIAKELIAQNPNTIVYLNTSSIVNLDEIQNQNGDFTGAALLWSTYLGQAQGTAVANVLSGKVNPSGHLTTTWYANENQLGELQHDYSIYPDQAAGDYGRTYMYFTGDVDYPFGYGLSYSDFNYSNFNMSSSSVTGDDKVTITCDVTNTTTSSAIEVVQVYAKGPNASQVNRPDKQLVGFDKVTVGAGQTVPVSIDVDVSDLAFWNETTNSFKMDLGTYSIYLGSDCDTTIANCSGTFQCTADITPQVYSATLTTDKYIAKAIGDKINTVTSVSMTNDTLYATKDKIPSSIALSYESSNNNVATVDQSGTITSVGEGVCYITVYADYNGKTVSDTHPIVVNTSVTGVSLDKSSASIQVGEATKLVATVSPTYSSDKAVTWSSSDQAVASVDQDGNVTGIAAGTATITVKTNDGGYTAACQVTVTDIPVTETKFTVGTPVFKDAAGNTMTKLIASSDMRVSVGITNNATAAGNACLILALYSPDGSVKNVSYLDGEIAAGQTYNFNAGFKLPENIAGYYVKVFVWDSMSGMTPLSNSITFQ